MGNVVPTDYTTSDLLSQIELADRRQDDFGHLRAVALGLLVLTNAIERGTEKIAAALDGGR